MPFVAAEHMAGPVAELLVTGIYRYFPAIDHAILKRDLRRRLACDPALALADYIIDGSNPQESVNLHFSGDDLFTPFERRRGPAHRQPAGIELGSLTGPIPAI